MGFDRVKEVISGLGEVGVDVEGEGVEGGSEGVILDGWVGFDVGDRGGWVEDALLEHGGDLVEEGGDEVGVMDLDGELDEDVAVFEAGLLETAKISKGICLEWVTYLSVVNLFSLKAAMNWGDNRNALKERTPCEVLLTSWTRATVFSLMSFW